MDTLAALCVRRSRLAFSRRSFSLSFSLSPMGENWRLARKRAMSDAVAREGKTKSEKEKKRVAAKLCAYTVARRLNMQEEEPRYNATKKQKSMWVCKFLCVRVYRALAIPDRSL